MIYQKERKIPWAKELDSFPVKNFTITTLNEKIQSRLMLSYSSEKDLQSMGIWYNAKKNQFSINHTPKENIKTKDGKLVDNYWVFNGNSNITFTMEPFLQMPERYQKFKKSLKKLLIENQKE
ncbi:hypothetical protein ATE84_4058 [Aquimarina sp. MAR_2010_214]|uniref:hypothetical protein n=1 Tax=Aquimarina sp. MAR_2010_214 TaxID=1250026 RepID=UPI000C705E05|nr:hypothetical protein [Aquimarina sp. MAR_2010_214]PKV51958.1 hypothetical protein ATE84_4058 [Aquimarina sp. MAR_2010_214]